MVPGARSCGPDAHENHEFSFMMSTIRSIALPEEYEAALSRSVDMKWETPQAVELRFGMEITMYVSNR
jgi:coenzyme PQQ precursor peptide PqqA